MRAYEPVRRAVLCVPASSEAMVDKAPARGADEIVLDLEDGVAPDAKERAREVCCRALRSWHLDVPLAVRVNAPGTPWCHRDILSVAEAGDRPLSIVVPKVESVGELDFVQLLLDGAEDRRRHPIAVQALIETATGLARVSEIAGARGRLESLILGYADLEASLGGSHELDDWRPAQHAVVTAARAHGVHAIDGPVLGLESHGLLRRATERARDLGFDGKWAIHPRQVDVLLEVFTPGDAEVARAAAMVGALERAQERGAGAATFEGGMIDEATSRAARRTLARAPGASA